MRRTFHLSAFLFCLLSLPLQAGATTIFASGQLLTENSPGTHDDVRENYIFSIDTVTGIATPFSPVIAGAPSALAGGPSGRLYGYSGGSFGEVNPSSGVFSPIGDSSGLSSSGFDIIQDLGFLVTFTDDLLYSVDLGDGVVQQIGGPITLSGLTSDPFIISLGSVGDTLYAVNLGTDANNLVSIDPLTAEAQVIGESNAVGRDGYAGFAALTGVDEDGDGVTDSLFGNVNFQNGNRIGGVVKFDLTSGEWALIGENPGVIFFGFGESLRGEPVPEPATIGLLGLGLAGALRRKRRKAESMHL